MTFLIATRNRHKVGEIRAILGNDHRYLTLEDVPDAPLVVEDAPTFAGNAAKKATALAAHLLTRPSTWPGRGPLYVLADDSGLEVDALNGAPGVHSARFAALDRSPGDVPAGNSPDADNNAKLLRLLADVPAERRTARFRCVIAVARLGGNNSGLLVSGGRTVETFDGVCEGRIEFAPRGQGGFGYDPLFVPAGWDRSFAELGKEEKNRLSHRAAALARLKSRLAQQSN
jgi:XTP/dITP diphosphohydrolase